MKKGTKKYKPGVKESMIRELRSMFNENVDLYTARQGIKLFYSRAERKLNDLGYKDPYGHDLDREDIKRIIYSSVGKSGLVNGAKRANTIRTTVTERNVTSKIPEVLRCIILDDTLKPTQRLKMFESWFEV